VTFGFVARSGDSAGLRGTRFQAVSGGSRSAEIGWNLWGMLPHLLPQAASSRIQRLPAASPIARLPKRARECLTIS